VVTQAETARQSTTRDKTFIDIHHRFIQLSIIRQPNPGGSVYCNDELAAAIVSQDRPAPLICQLLLCRYTAAMRFILSIVFILPLIGQAADIQLQSTISCISDESSLRGRHRQSASPKNSEQAKSRFSEWMMAENFDAGKSKVRFTWKPRGIKGPSIGIDTTDKAHNLIRIRSQTRSSLIVVSSASNPFSTESHITNFYFD
jgi:hypothetical protein